MAAEEWWKPYMFELMDDRSRQPVTVNRLRDRLVNSEKLRAQYSRVMNHFASKGSKNSSVVIPVVVRRNQDSLDDAEILVIGDPVTWPEGMAAQTMNGELSVLAATFRRAKNQQTKENVEGDSGSVSDGPKRRPVSAWTERTRRHRDMEITIYQSEAQGERETMQDRFVIHLFNGIAVFGLFDGHGGVFAADFASKAIIPALKAQFERAKERGVNYTFTDSNPQPPDAIERETIKSMMESLNDAVADIEHETIELCASKPDYSGTTLCVCLCTRGTLLVANVGDSRVVVSRKGVAKVVTKDHQVTNPDERRRILEEGGKINSENYLGGQVGLSRSIGDIDPTTGAKIVGLSAEPDIVEFTLDREKDEFVIVACDGLWDVMSNQAAVQQVRTSLKASKGNMLHAADELVAKALALKTTDNVTVLIAYLPIAPSIWASTPSAHSGSVGADCDESGRPKLFKKG